MLKIKRLRLTKPIPVTKLIPNILTLLGLVIGVSSIRFGLEAKWEQAVYCIFTACIIDVLDGGVARLLNATSIFGAELDSLCDFVNFGLCPAILIYLWSFQHYEYKLISWSAVLLYIICMGIRLARFNTISINNTNDELAKYFIGVPAPLGALLALLPMILDFEISKLFNFEARYHTILIDCYLAFIAVLLPSRLPTFSLKNIHIPPKYLSISMIIAATIIINFLVYPWYFLPILIFVYMLSIPLCFKIYRQDKL